MMRAILVVQQDGKISAALQEISKDQLPPGEVLVRVAYSSLNYKDVLAVTGKPGVIRKFPMVAGIDFARHRGGDRHRLEFRPGDPVSADRSGGERKRCGAATPNTRDGTRKIWCDFPQRFR